MSTTILTDAAESGHVTFEDLYAQYHAAIARRARCFLVRDPDLVEDVLQETWIAVWKALPRMKTVSYAWLYRITTNTAISALRKKYHCWPGRGERRITPPLSLDTCYGDEGGDLPLGEMLEDPRQCDPAESDRVDIGQALARLTPNERYLLALRAEGYQFNEIEQVLGKGQRMTWLYVDRAREAFRHSYQEVA